MIQKKMCAIYARKSTEEGLDMDFNSLDAQREACASYILSQKSEGWMADKRVYDDGGFSGGSLERPALKCLLEDIKLGKINIVVVYKIDRLTRSLMDFSKLVEVFDEFGVTFVSVTQSFNTTTSMGRLTLNVLLSFAQFEREVTGERIRDKIAASKKKGMWMGGGTPLGYSLEGRHLIVNLKESPLIEHIFNRYSILKSVRSLKREMDKEKIESPFRKSKVGKIYGGRQLSAGNLYSILKNPVYIGKIRHKEKVYDGVHDAIISEKLWRSTQAILKENSVERSNTIRHRHMLSGILFDMNGDRYSPSYAGKDNRRYRYYVSQNLLKYRDHPKGLIARLPAEQLEKFVETTVRERIAECWLEEFEGNSSRIFFLENAKNIVPDKYVQGLVEKVIVGIDTMTIKLKPEGITVLAEQYLEIKVAPDEVLLKPISVPFKTKRGGCGAVLLGAPQETKDIFDMPAVDLKRLIQGVVWRDEHFAGLMLKDIAQREGFSEGYVSKAIFTSFKSLQVHS